MYTKVSIPKSGDNAGAAVPKDPTIILIDVESIETEPSRNPGDTALAGNFTLKEGEKAIGIYATPSTIQLTEEVSGEPDGKGITKGLVFQHPGNTDAIKNFLEANLNRGFVALVKDCDGSSTGRTQVVGSKCNPLVPEWSPTLNNEGTRREITLKQGMADGFMAGTYTGTIPDLAPAAATAPAGSGGEHEGEEETA